MRMAEQATTTHQGGDPNQHVTVNSVLCYIGGGLTVFIGLFVFIATLATGAFVDQWDSSGIARFWIEFGAFVALFFTIVVGLPAILAGVGLGKRAEWGRILALVVAAVNILLGLTLLFGNFMAIINLAWGGYAFWSLMQPNVVELFRPEAQAN